MRREIENPELMKKRIEREKWEAEFVKNTKLIFEEQGRDFDAEFAAWQASKQKNSLLQ